MAAEAGLSLSEFYDMSPRQFKNYMDGYRARMVKQYEHTRAICYFIAASNRDPKKSFPTMQKFWPLPTDERTTEVLDRSRAEKIRQLYEQAKQKING